MIFTIHTKPGCSWCEDAKTEIKSNGDDYVEIVYSTQADIDGFKAMGFKTFPQIYLKSRRIGGYEDLLDFYTDLDVIPRML